jgi:butyryl-CoA dehydrogenase
MLAKNVRFVKLCSNCSSRTFTTKLPNELKSLQELCKKFSNEELKPVADQLDKAAKFPKKQIQKLGKLGLMGICVSSDYGGSNMNTLALSVAVEELSQGCASTGSIVSIHNCLYANLLNRLGSNEQKKKYLRPFTDGNKIGAFALSESGSNPKIRY